MRRLRSVLGLSLLSAVSAAAFAGCASGGALEFPADRSLGAVVLFDPVIGAWKDAGAAQGKVAIPAGAVAGLKVAAASPADLAALPADTIQSLDFSRSGVDDAGLAAIAHLKSLRALDLSGAKITDAGLASLAGMTQLETVILRDTSIAGAGLANLKASAATLTKLDLARTKIDDAALAHVAPLAALKTLDLAETKLTDASAAHLKGLSNLTFLYMQETQLGDAGLAQLESLEAMQQFEAFKTKVTPKGAEKFRLALPDCRLKI